MKSFHCDHCQHLVFFENTHCVSCGHVLAYLPDRRDMAALEPVGNEIWRSLGTEHPSARYRLCENYRVHAVCNWALPEDESSDFCLACRLTREAPPLTDDASREARLRLEIAKRRLVYTLLDLGLPLAHRTQKPRTGLAFDFRGDEPGPDGKAVLTGHAGGIITINVAEADDVERERRRLSLHEPYRTLLGHFRHEIGHYYWDVIFRDRTRLEAFRAQFGDEREDYAAALQRHYQHGAPVDWPSRFISAYASTHPWEDWAETWAHYLHMIDSLDTAAACGVALQPRRQDEPRLAPVVQSPVWELPFERIFNDWVALSYVLNNLNRSLGLADGYPFVLSIPSVDKLRHVHDVIRAFQKKRLRKRLRPRQKPSTVPDARSGTPDVAGALSEASV